MFTGLIEDIGYVVDIRRKGEAAEISLSTSISLEEVKIGDSIAVNGICLTVTKKAGKICWFDISPETFSSTNAVNLTPSAAVNLERALALGDRLGGHLVSGHIDCVATVMSVIDESGNRRISFRIPEDKSRYVIQKGSVTINGVSLTVNEVTASSFSVNIIPHTASKTTLNQLKSGDIVNIETDMIGKFIEKLLIPWHSGNQSSLTIAKLMENGFA